MTGYAVDSLSLNPSRAGILVLWILCC